MIYHRSRPLMMSALHPLPHRKIYAKNLKFCIAAVFVVCQRDNHILE